MTRSRLELRYYQAEALEATMKYWANGGGNPLITMATGCHALGTKILMHNGSVKNVEDVVIGDFLMGPDSKAREVLSLARGNEPMVRVTPIKGSPFVVNEGHILSLRSTNQGACCARWGGYQTGAEVKNVSIRDWVTWSANQKHLYKLRRVAVDFPYRELPLISGWELGIILGDGHLCGGSLRVTTADQEIATGMYELASRFDVGVLIGRKPDNAACDLRFTDAKARRNIPNPMTTEFRSLGVWGSRCDNKHIPDAYKLGSEGTRLGVLAGLLDSDGHFTSGGFDFISKSERLADDVAFVASSLGFAAYVRPCEKFCQTGGGGTYHRVSISGDVCRIPTRIPRKIAPARLQKKSVLKTGFSIEPIGSGDFYGFSLSGDHLYLTADFTVHHNTGKSPLIAALSRRLMTEFRGFRILMLVHVKELVEQNARELLHAWPGAPIGINSAGIGRRDTYQDILYGSIQSLWRKPELLGDRDLVIIDECHLLPKANVGMYRTLLNALLAVRPDMRIAGFTATPFRLDSGRLDKGPDKLFDKEVYNYGIARGIEDGYLCPLVPLRMANEIETGGLSRRGGDFTDASVAAAADNDAVIAGAAAELVRHGEHRKSWLSFCCGVEHAHKIADATRALGISSATITGTTPNDERTQIIRDYKEGRIRHLTNALVLCLDSKTEILTTAGWTGMNEMTDQHMVAAWDNHKIIFSPPSNIVKRPLHEGEIMVSVCGNRNDIRVTGNHRMVVRSSRTGDWIKRSAEEIVDLRLHIPVSGIADASTIKAPQPESMTPNKRKLRIATLTCVYKRRGVPEARIAATKYVDRRYAMRYKDPSELTLDDCHFIGFWLGDGTLSPRCEFSQSNTYPNIIEWFDGVLERMKLGHSKSSSDPTAQLKLGAVRWSIARGTGGCEQRREHGYFPLEPYLKKDGTELFWGLDVQQFEALIRGLWLADGNHGQGIGNKSRGVFITSVRESILDLLQAIGACRGYRFTKWKRPQPSNKKHKVAWSLSWRKADSVEMVRERMAIEPRIIEEMVWCVTSATGNIVTRRGGRVAVVGNTTGFNSPGTDLVALFRPTLSQVLYVQTLGRGTRLLGQTIAESTVNGKPDTLVLDFAGNVRRHGPVDTIDGGRESRGIQEADDDERPVVRADDVRACVCPHCDAYNDLGALRCVNCDGVIKEEAPKHQALAEVDLAILSIDRDPYEAISNTTFNKHVKIGSPHPTLRVEYKVADRSNLFYKEWICLQHPGFQGSKARMWWSRLGGSSPEPQTIDEALSRSDELRVVTHVKVKEENGYKVVAARRLDPIERYTLASTAPREITSGANRSLPTPLPVPSSAPPGLNAW